MAIEMNPGDLTRQDILAWLIDKVAQELWLEAATLDLLKPFRAYGMDSISAAVLMGEIAEHMQLDVSPTLFEEYPTINALATHLAARKAEALETSL